ncbi:MAG: hypothetical protein R3F42_09870 [Pseudomonadota bacterium]
MFELSSARVNARLLYLLFMLLAGCGGGGGGVAQTMTLSVAVSTPSETSLDWMPHSGLVSGYDIVRNGAAAFPVHVSGTSFIDRNLEPQTRYCYVIYAILFPVGTVGQSNQVCVTTPGTAGWHTETIGTGSEPALALDAGNQPHVSYRDGNVVMHAWRDGAGWVYATVDGGAGTTGDTDIQIDQSGAGRLSYADSVNFSLKHAGNATGVWISETADLSAGIVNALAVDDNGNAHIVYTGSSMGDVKYVTNASGTWQPEFISGFSNASVLDMDILVDSAGYVHLVFASVGLDCYVYYMNNTGGSLQGGTMADDCKGGVAVAVDSAGIVHIAYTRQFSVMHAWNPPAGWQYEQVDSFSWIGGDRVGIALDMADRVHIAYQDQNGDLKYATNVSGVWERSYIDAVGEVGGNPGIAVDPAGRVSIVYTDQTNHTVKLATGP